MSSRSWQLREAGKWLGTSVGAVGGGGTSRGALPLQSPQHQLVSCLPSSPFLTTHPNSKPATWALSRLCTGHEPPADPFRTPSLRSWRAHPRYLLCPGDPMGLPGSRLGPQTLAPQAVPPTLRLGGPCSEMMSHFPQGSPVHTPTHAQGPAPGPRTQPVPMSCRPSRLSTEGFPVT